tara:strand:+ start:1501 stop:1698 length:198 start_codon:yes stop_codon:yes gene_type:complete
MKIEMIESVCTALGAFNQGEIYEVDDAQGKEFIKLGYAISHKSKRVVAAKSPSKRKAVKKGAVKR